MSEPEPVPETYPPAAPEDSTPPDSPLSPSTAPSQALLIIDAPSSREEVKYQGPVETTALVSYTENPSPEQALPKRDRII